METTWPRREGTTHVATYNLWNSTVNWEQRLAAMVDELHALAADVVAMQEAPNEASSGRSLALRRSPRGVAPADGRRPRSRRVACSAGSRPIASGSFRAIIMVSSSIWNSDQARVLLDIPGRVVTRIQHVHLPGGARSEDSGLTVQVFALKRGCDLGHVRPAPRRRRPGMGARAWGLDRSGRPAWSGPSQHRVGHSGTNFCRKSSTRVDFA